MVEIGCVELVERRPTGRTFQRYLNPEREFEPGAQEVTGLTLEFLADKPQFAEVVDEFLAFIDGAELVIHNAAFDVGFLDNELRAGSAPHYGRLRDRCGVEDSLVLARQRFPGQRNSLDALCRRLGVDNSHRQLHGALLDAQLLAEVYLGADVGPGRDRVRGRRGTVAARSCAGEVAARRRPRPRVIATGTNWPRTRRAWRSCARRPAARSGMPGWKQRRAGRADALPGLSGNLPRAAPISAGGPAPRSRCPSRRHPAPRRPGIHAFLRAAVVVREHVGDAAVVDFLGEAVAAQQQLHARAQFAGHGLDVELVRVGHAQRLRHHVAVRMAARLFGADRALAISSWT